MKLARLLVFVMALAPLAAVVVGCSSSSEAVTAPAENGDAAPVGEAPAENAEPKLDDEGP